MNTPYAGARVPLRAHHSWHVAPGTADGKPSGGRAWLHGEEAAFEQRVDAEAAGTEEGDDEREDAEREVQLVAGLRSRRS